MLKRLAIPVAVALAVVGCAGSGTGSTKTPTAGHVGSSVIESKAADLRTRLDLLLGEHLLIVAKVSNAAAGGRSDEYAGYATLLTTNGDDITRVIRSAFGTSTASRFDQAWRAQDGYLIDYMIGAVSHNTKKSNAAAAGLVNDFVPQLAQVMSSATQQPVDAITQLMRAQVLATKGVIDDQVAKSYGKMYADLRTAFAQSTLLGDTLATAIAVKFPDKFPGDSMHSAVDFRVALNTLLLEHAYLSTMTTGALAGARNAEQAAATGALAANANALKGLFGDLLGSAEATRFDQVWSARNAELVIYSGSSDALRRQNALVNLVGPTAAQFTGFFRDATGIDEPSLMAPVQTQTHATIHVIDDQRASLLNDVAADDRTSAASMEPIANLIAAAAMR
jgi:hypothetical protein